MPAFDTDVLTRILFLLYVLLVWDAGLTGGLIAVYWARGRGWRTYRADQAAMKQTITTMQETQTTDRATLTGLVTDLRAEMRAGHERLQSKLNDVATAQSQRDIAEHVALLTRLLGGNGLTLNGTNSVQGVVAGNVRELRHEKDGDAA